jgi:hypothetical protein
MANRKALKPKDIQRLFVLNATHPGDRTPAEEKELITLEALRVKYG